MATTTASLIAVTPGGAITDEHIAGHFFWYSIEERMTPLHKVRRAFADNGLDPTRLPEERRLQNVAIEAFRSVERVTSNSHREEIRAEQVMRSEDSLVYQITRHVQDKAHRVIEHPKALRAIFTYETGELTFEPLGGATHADVRMLTDEISAHYNNNQQQIPGKNLRTIVRHYVEAAGAENMRGQSGGVYFLAKHNPIPTWSKLYGHHGDSISGGEFIQRIRMMLEDIYGTAPNFHDIPCINDEGQREFLKRKFIENCAEDLKAFRDECLDLVKAKNDRIRRVREDKRTGMVQRRRDMDVRRQKFAAVLGEQLQELDRDMTLADKALAKFLTEADL